MKKFFIVLQFFFIQTILFSQSQTPVKNAYGIYTEGIEKTASGTLKVLVVFVRFKDDTAPWADGTIADSLPNWAKNYVDPSIPSNGIYTKVNLSNLIDRESGGDGAVKRGKFQIIGDVYYVTTSQNKNYYISDADVNKDVLQQLDDPNGPYKVDFRKYDNWTFKVNNINYNHRYSPFNPATETGGGDTYVDQIFIIFRSPSINTALEKAGGYSNLELATEFVTNDGMHIRKNDGSTILKGINLSAEPKTFLGPAHEYGHYLFSGPNGADNTLGHFDGRSYYNTTNGYHLINTGLLAEVALMMGVSAGNFSMYERYRLGWLTPTYINSNSNVTLSDSHVENSAVIVPLRFNTDRSLAEYFLIENYQSTSDYSNADPFNVNSLWGSNINHGILIFHILNEDLNYPTISDISIECADGLWNWYLQEGSSTPLDLTDDLIAKLSPGYNTGYDERDYIQVPDGNKEYVALKPYSSDNYPNGCYIKDSFLGDNEDFFNKGTNEIFSPWSNPNTSRNDKSTSNIGIRITGYNNATHTYSLSIAVDNTTCLSFPPSKPQNLIASQLFPKVVLTWEQNKESDMISGGKYRLERSTSENGTYTPIGSLINQNQEENTLQTYTDNSCQNNTTYYYKVFAIDAGQNESLPSDAAKVVVPYTLKIPNTVLSSPNSYKADYILAGTDSLSFIVNNGAYADIDASTSITLGSGFLTNDGSEIHAHITPPPSIRSLLNDEYLRKISIRKENLAQNNLQQPPNESLKKPLPKKFSLSQSYPNPCNPSARIAYELPNASKVTLKVYDILGKEVAELVNQNQDAGYYNVTFNGSNLSSGVYIYMLKAGNFVSTKKFILLK